MKIVEALVDYGFDINARGTETGFTPLHDAVKGEHKTALIYLLEKGADPYIKDNNNMDVMEFAVDLEMPKYIAIIEKYYFKNK